MIKLPEWYTKAIGALERRLKRRDSVKDPSRPSPTHAKPAEKTLPTRRIHLGVDYGTAWSKLVFRDYEAPGRQQSHVVFADDGARRRGEFRFPSIVTSVRDRLYFGNEAKRWAAEGNAVVWSSMKMRMALPDQYYGRQLELPDGFSAEDIATLTVAYLLQHGRRDVEAHCHAHRCTPRLGFTLGVPMTDRDNPDLAARFVSVARIATVIERHEACPDLRDGLDHDTARNLLDAGTRGVSDLGDAEARKWIRSEFEAALHWPFRSPSVTAGLYAALDVGAGTTSASFFRVIQDYQGGRWVNEGMAFFGASCRPPGGDAIDEKLAPLIHESDPANVRGRENELLMTNGSECIQAVINSIVETYSLAFRRSYAMDPRLPMWEDFRIFLVGGGTQIDVLRNHGWTPPRANLHLVPEVMCFDCPDDLVLQRVPASELKFLLVAYGLSYADGDIPQVLMPGEIAPLVVRHHEVEMDRDNPPEFRPTRR